MNLVNSGCLKLKNCFSSAIQSGKECFSSGAEKVASLGSSALENVNEGLKWLGKGVLKLDQYTTKIVPSIEHIKKSWNQGNKTEMILGSVQLVRGVANFIAGVSLTSLVEEGVWQKPFDVVGPFALLTSFFCNFVLEGRAVYNSHQLGKRLDSFNLNTCRLKFDLMQNPKFTNRIEKLIEEDRGFVLESILKDQKRSSLFLSTLYLSCLIAETQQLTETKQQGPWLSLGLSGLAALLKAGRFSNFLKRLQERKLPDALSEITLDPSPEFSTPNPSSPSPVPSESPVPFGYGRIRSESSLSLASQQSLPESPQESGAKQPYPIATHSESPIHLCNFTHSESNLSLREQSLLDRRGLHSIPERSLSLQHIAELYQAEEARKDLFQDLR